MEAQRLAIRRYYIPRGSQRHRWRPLYVPRSAQTCLVCGITRKAMDLRRDRGRTTWCNALRLHGPNDDWTMDRNDVEDFMDWID